MDRYVERSDEEVEELFLSMGFHEVALQGCREMVFERKVVYQNMRKEGPTDISTLVDTGLTVRVYTSVSNNGTRKCGKDAGRVILIDDKTGKPVWKAKRVHRTQGFMDNIKQRCRDAWKAAANVVKCPDCDGHMVARKRKGEKKESFYGCLKFPECRGTRSIARLSFQEELERTRDPLVMQREVGEVPNDVEPHDEYGKPIV